MRMLLALMIVMVLAYGCASSKGKDGEEREFDLTYKVINAEYKSIPGWLTEPEGWAQLNDKADAKKFRYFVSTTDLIKNKRLCTKSAEAQAAAKIAGEITQFIKDSYAQTVSGDGDAEVETYMDETLAQEIQAFIVGARVHRTYWEERAYKEDMGAEADKTGYVCSALMKMSASTLQAAIKKAAKKVEGVTTDPESKEKVKKALDDVEKKFETIRG